MGIGQIAIMRQAHHITLETEEEERLDIRGPTRCRIADMATLTSFLCQIIQNLLGF